MAWLVIGWSEYGTNIYWNDGLENDKTGLLGRYTWTILRSEAKKITDEETAKLIVKNAKLRSSDWLFGIHYEKA